MRSPNHCRAPTCRVRASETTLCVQFRTCHELLLPCTTPRCCTRSRSRRRSSASTAQSSHPAGIGTTWSSAPPTARRIRGCGAYRPRRTARSRTPTPSSYPRPTTPAPTRTRICSTRCDGRTRAASGSCRCAVVRSCSPPRACWTAAARPCTGCTRTTSQRRFPWFECARPCCTWTRETCSPPRARPPRSTSASTSYAATTGRQWRTGSRSRWSSPAPQRRAGASSPSAAEEPLTRGRIAWTR